MERIAYGRHTPDPEGSLSPGARIRSLSGGQRTRIALALAFGKRPELMLLDEPMADLDPLARRELLGALLGEAAEHGTTIVMSSHVVAELEGAWDHLLLLGGGRIRLGGDPDQLLAAHTLVTGPVRDLTGLLVGRALPAPGVAFAALLAVFHLGNEYRPSLWPTVTTARPSAGPPPSSTTASSPWPRSPPAR